MTAPPSNAPPSFLFVTCQVGAENAVKFELANRWPSFRFAYSRPGFLTFKLLPGHDLAEDFELGSIFARSYGFSLGKARDTDPERLAKAVWELAGDREFDRLHVWSRDTASPGSRGFEVGLSERAGLIEQAVRAAAPAGSSPLGQGARARRGQRVLDCVLVGPDECWIGYHRAGGFATRLPGGWVTLKPPEEMISRDWLKTEEALRWSQFPLAPGERAIEIGCAPGGSSQALLKRGLYVTGIDPALVDPRLRDEPRFRQIRKRGSETRRSEFRAARWLFVDINLAPNYALDMVEEIVASRGVDIRGMLLTLKLLDWRLAEHSQEYLDRVRSWGYRRVTARQLSHNHQEFCLAAAKRRPSFRS